MGEVSTESAREFAENVFDTVREPLLVLDMELRVLRANRSFYDKFQLTPEQTLQRPIDEIDALRIPKLPSLLEEISTRHTSITDFEVEHEFPKIGRRILLLNGSKMLRPGNDTKSILLAIEDVTEQRHAEQRLRYESSLLSAVSEAVISLTHDFRIRTWNPAAERMLGFTRDEALGHPSEDVLSVPENLDRQAIRQALLNGDSYRGETRLRCKDGSLLDVESTVVGIRDANNELVGFVSVLRDTTKRKELEAQLREHMHQLEEANRELDGFTYSVSHDLRAPLRAIDGFSRILLEDYANNLDVEGQRLANIIRKNTQKMAQLIDDLLAFSRLGRKQLTLLEVNMTQLAQTVVDELSSLEVDRDIEFRVGELPRAVCDPALMKQVWTNLLSNAIKYTRPRPKAEIEIQGKIEGHETIYVVKDNGVGFDMQYVDKLFGVFQRLHSGSDFEGTGVGLALVHRIVRKHGGHIWADGKVGEGATFTFAIPMGVETKEPERE